MPFTKKEGYYTGTVYEWNLPTGYSCPFARQCLVKVDRETGEFDNRSDQYRCYAASAERFPGVRESRWANFDAMKRGEKPEIPEDCKAIRIHASGDFFSQKYFDTWLEVCRDNPEVEFWAYTKSVPYWVKRLGQIPPNLVLTASIGGKHDKLILKHRLKYVKIIKDPKMAGKMPIDTNDDYARKPKINFCLVDNYF